MRRAIKAHDANVQNMAVTVTLVFGDEAHREAWLLRTGVIPRDHGDGRLIDYMRRRDGADLIYTVAPEFSSHPPLTP